MLALLSVAPSLLTLRVSSRLSLSAAGGIGRNAEELLRLLQAAQFVAEHGDQVCPAKWQPGAETLKPSLDLVGQL